MTACSRSLAAALLAACLAACLAANAGAQEQQAKQRKKLEPAPLFESEAPLEATLTANLGQLRKDKGENPPWRAGVISYVAPTGEKIDVPVRTRTRGIWRRKNCEFPPLRLDFAGASSKQTAFSKLDRPKLVNYCRGNWTGDQYILQEYQLYRVYNLLSPLSHRGRLLKLSYADSGTGKVRATHYAILLEEPRAVADRNNLLTFDTQGVLPEELDPATAGLHWVFQYFIGNTDFDVGALHNVEVFQDMKGVYYPVPYDFDYAGAVEAFYATTDPRLPIRKVTERLYRGYCLPDSVMLPVIARFREKREAIRALYADPIGKLLPDDVTRKTLRFFDEFYATIENPKRLREAILEHCPK